VKNKLKKESNNNKIKGIINNGIKEIAKVFKSMDKTEVAH
jgi:hypothetical protein